MENMELWSTQDRQQVTQWISRHLLKELSSMVMTYFPSIDLYLHLPSLKNTVSIQMEPGAEVLRICVLGSDIQKSHIHLDLKSFQVTPMMQNIMKPTLVENDDVMSLLPLCDSTKELSGLIPTRYFEHTNLEIFAFITSNPIQAYYKTLFIARRWTDENKIKIIFSTNVHETFMYSQHMNLDWDPSAGTGHLILVIDEEEHPSFKLFEISDHKEEYQIAEYHIPLDAMNLRLCVSTTERKAIAFMEASSESKAYCFRW